MKRTTNTILAILLLLPALSFGMSIDCHTPRMDKEFTITPAQITFYEEAELTPTRSIASVQLVRTRKTVKGFTKILNIDGHRYSIHIENTESFSDVDDYIAIKNGKGHEVTYPLTCKNSDSNL